MLSRSAVSLYREARPRGGPHQMPPVELSRENRFEAPDSTKVRASARSPKLAESLARDLAENIFSRGLEPGARLPSERVLLEQLQVSRGTLREALRILEVHGL